MNNFEQNDDFFAHLQQVANNLTLIANHTQKITPIERDIILQSLREAYLDVMKLEVCDEIPANEETISTPVEPAPTTPADNQEISRPSHPTPEPETSPLAESIIAPENTDNQENTTSSPLADSTPTIEETSLPEPTTTPADNEEITDLQDIPEETMESASALLNESGDILDFLGTTIDAAWTMPEKTVTPQPEPKTKNVVAQPMPASPQPETPHFSRPDTPQPAPDNTPTPPQKTKNEFTFSDSLFPNEPAQPAPSHPEQKKSLHDVLAQQHEDNSLATRYQHSHIDDITKAISINDKFAFIRELFKGKSEDFSRAIQKLNSASSLEEATAELGRMKLYYAWDTSSDTYQSLCELVKRKFM